MPLDQDKLDKFKQIANFISAEISYKLTSLINRNASFEFVGIEDSIMTVDKIAIKKDCFLVSTQTTEPALGPISLIVSNPQVFTIADLVMGGDGIAKEDVKPDETNQMVYAETLNQVIKSLLTRFEQYATDAKLESGEHEYRELISIKDATLKQPDGVEEPTALKFKVNISAKLDDEISFEVNNKLLEYIIEHLSPVLENLDLAEFSSKVKQEYLPEEEVEEEEKVTYVDDGSDDAYKVDEKRNLSILTDINLDLVVELGRSEMTFDQLLHLSKGSAIELERQCNEPVDLYAHNQLIAKGEVVAIDDCFGLKITEVLGDLKLAKKMGLSLK